jgi:elongation factor 1 alpha-like protein
MRPFLQAAGFAADKTTFIPVAAMAGVNLANGDNPQLRAWYKGPTLVDVLGMYSSDLSMCYCD